MSWLTNVIRPKIRALVGKTDVPENLWHKCGNCGQMLFHRELEQNQFVCNYCDHHMRISARQRLGMLFDDGEFTEIELPTAAVDPLKFRDRKRYTERLKDAQAKTELSDAVIVAHGSIWGHKAVIVALDFAFMGGSMGVAVGEAVIAAAELAKLQDAPLIAIPASGGARMQEGILSLVQLPRTVIAVETLREAGLPYLVVLSDPTTGGVSASFAMLGDIQIAEPGATIGFAGKRVIEQTIREQLPEGFQSAEYLRDHGMVDMVVHRHQLRNTIARVIDLLRRTRPAAEIVPLVTATAAEDAAEPVAAANDPSPAEERPAADD